MSDFHPFSSLQKGYFVSFSKNPSWFLLCNIESLFDEDNAFSSTFTASIFNITSTLPLDPSLFGGPSLANLWWGILRRARFWRRLVRSCKAYLFPLRGGRLSSYLCIDAYFKIKMAKNRVGDVVILYVIVGINLLIFSIIFGMAFVLFSFRFT